jgi:hypothetical protein
MDDEGLLLRIRVITVSTRAAVRSLGPDDPQVPEVVERGRSLLDELAPEVQEHGNAEAREALDRARTEIRALVPEG